MELESVWDFFSDLIGINKDYEQQFVNICDEYRILPSKLREIWNRVSRIRKTGCSLTSDSFTAFIRYITAKIREPGYEPVYFNRALKAHTIKDIEIEQTLCHSDFSQLIDEMTTIPGDIDLDLLRFRQAELVHRIRCVNEDYYEKLYKHHLEAGKEVYKGVLIKMNQNDDDLYRMNSFGSSIKEQPFILVYIEEQGSSTLKHIHLHFNNKTDWTGVLYTGKPVVVIGERATFTKFNVEFVEDGKSEIDLEESNELSRTTPVFKINNKINNNKEEIEEDININNENKEFELTITIIKEDLSKGELSVYENIKGNLSYKFERLKEDFMEGKTNLILILGPFINQTSFSNNNDNKEDEEQLSVTNSYKKIFKIIRDLKKQTFKEEQNVFIEIINSPNEFSLFPIIPVCSPLGYKDKGLKIKSNPCTSFIKTQNNNKVRIGIMNYDVIFQLMKHSTFVMHNSTNQKLDLIAKELIDMDYYTPLLETPNDYFIDYNKSSMLHKTKYVNIIITTSKLVEFVKKTKEGKLILNVNHKKESQCWFITGIYNKEVDKIDLNALRINL